MKIPETLAVRVTGVESLTPAIKRFELSAAEGGQLPGFSAGSHVMLHLPCAGRTHRNAYSLLGSPDERSTYRIAVRLQEHSRGGSAYLHAQVGVGDVLQINPPANLFSLDRLARRHILIAGGIGITPFMSYLHELAGQQAPYQLHYAYRAPEQAVFRDELEAQLGKLLYQYNADREQFVRPLELLAAQPLGTHVYVCGPQGLIDAVSDAARELGWPDSHVHQEQFSAPRPGTPFRVSCAKTDREIEVPADVSLLDALEAAGIEVPNLCRGGVCGQCETGLLEGEAEHRDSYLSAALRGRKIMPCVSRALSERLVLDL